MRNPDPLRLLTFVVLLTACGGDADPSAPTELAQRYAIAGATGLAGSTDPVTTSTEDGRLTTGWGFSCALRQDDTLSCWGGGPGAGTQPATYARVSGGRTHICGLRHDGTLSCWGGDGSGQSNHPPGTFFEVSSGGYAACAIWSDETVACWGSNAHGSLDLPPGTYKRVAVDAGNTCGILTDGSVVCVGLNVPGALVPFPSGEFEQITIGNAGHACALRAEGTLVCWGANQYRQLEGVPDGIFTQINAGHNFTCGLRPEGTIECWGPNIFGETHPPAGHFVRISAGGYHACAQRADDSIVCWGLNDEGQTDVPAEFASTPLVTDAGPDQTVECGAEGCGRVTVEGSGSGAGLTFTWYDAAGNELATGSTAELCLGPGSHTLTLEASDGLTTATDQVLIEVVDGTAPELTVAVSPESLWPPGHRYATLTVELAVDDACDDELELQGVISSSEPDDATGDGDGATTGDIRVTRADGSVLLSSTATPIVPFDPRTDRVEVRAERAGGGKGRVYTVSIIATDDAGNTSTAESTVNVPHDR